MITFLQGTLIEKTPERAVINVSGVGYAVNIPLTSYEKLPESGSPVKVLTYYHVREDAHLLFGFATEDERSMFERLLGVSGIGPKTALTALSGMSVRELKASIVGADIKRLSSISGIGKKTAERIVVELKDKITAGEALEAVAGTESLPEDGRLRDTILALVSLGYKQADALSMSRMAAEKAGPGAAVEDLIKAALTKSLKK